MPDTFLYLQIVRFEPRVGHDLNVSTLPDIKIFFNQDIDTAQVTNDSRLNQYFILINMDTHESIPLTFVDWDSAAKKLTIRPATSLAAGEVYQVTIRKELATAQGRRMTLDRIWVFQTSGIALGRVLLLEPGDATAFVDPPTLKWAGVAGPTGNIYYQVQVDDNWGFGHALVWTTTITVSGSGGIHAADIATALSDNTAYYWRARAYTESVTGDWSEVRTFYIGGSSRPAPDTIQLFQPDLSFILLDLIPENGSSNLSVWPDIRATFSRDVSGSTVDSSTFQIWALPSDGSGGGVASQITSGVYTVVGNQADLDFLGSPNINTRYTVRLTPAIASISGDYFEETVEVYFTGRYSPLYGGVIDVRAMLGGFINDTTDDEINFHLWKGSLEVNNIIFTFNNLIRENVSEQELINFVPAKFTWPMKRYAELAAAISLLESYYMDVAKEAGRREILATFQYEVAVELLAELRERIKELKKAKDEIKANFLMGIVIPRTLIKSQLWHPQGPYSRDDSYVWRRNFGKNKWNRDYYRGGYERNFDRPHRDRDSDW